jgi:RNA polymerase sigma-70 factor (ECF subfamily)
MSENDTKSVIKSGIYPTVRLGSDGQPVRYEGQPARRSDGMSLEEEAALVKGMIENSPRAWREFRTRYDRLLHRCIAKVTRRFNASDEDVMEIYATFLLSLLANDKKKLRSFDPERGSRFSSWIGLLAINAAYDHLRALKREPPKEEIGELHDHAIDTPSPLDAIVDRQHAAIAARTLEGFSETDRAFAALYFGEGMDPAEIAVKLNISIKTVYSKKHKIQARLMESLRRGKIAA